MTLLASAAVTDRMDVLGTALQVSESCIVIELEEGSVHTFDAHGQPLKLFTSQDDEAFSKRFKGFSLVGDKLLVAKETIGQLELIDTVTGKTTTSMKLSEQPKKIIPYHDGQFDFIIASASLANVQLISLSSKLEIPAPKMITATADIPSYKIFKHHIAQSTLALLCARGIVQLWHIPSLMQSDKKLRNMCTICFTESFPPLSSDTGIRQRSEERAAAEIFCVLVHSTNRILTGHGDGKIKLWDISIVSEEMSFRKEGYHPRFLSKPVCIVQNSTPGYLVNGFLEYHQAGSTTPNVVSTDTDGFVKLWRFHDHNSSNNFQLSLVGQHKLFDHAVLCRAITTEGWLVAGGKEGGSQEDVCGLDAQVKALKLVNLDNESTTEVKELGDPSLAVWDLKIVNHEGS